MSILQCLLILSALAPLLVTGPNLVPAQAFAVLDDSGDNKSTKDYKNSIQRDVNAKVDHTNQQLDQDNLCHKDDDCEQANGGEQLEGTDNTAEGFNDQSKNIQQQPAVTTISPTSPGNGTTPTPTPTPTPPEGKAILTLCKEVINTGGTDLVAADFEIFFNSSFSFEVTPDRFRADENCTNVVLDPVEHVFHEFASEDYNDIVINPQTSGECRFTFFGSTSPHFEITAVEGMVHNCKITNIVSPR